jgi:hypothetical protein
MIRQFIQITLLTGTLLVGLVPLAIAGPGGMPPESTGVVATVTAVDTKTDMATLTTDEGEVFELPKEELWKVGSKVECDRRDEGPVPRLQNCQPWD